MNDPPCAQGMEVPFSLVASCFRTPVTFRELPRNKQVAAVIFHQPPLSL